MSNFKPQLTHSSSEDIMEYSYDRPVGVSIIAALFMLSGVIGIILNLVNSNMMEQTELPALFKVSLLVSVYFLSVISIAAGIGTWKGKTWGWRITLFYFSYIIVGGLRSMLLFPALLEAFGTVPGGAGSFYIKTGFKIMFHGLVLAYCFRESVTSYFQVESVSKIRALGIVFGISAILFIAGNFLTKMVE